METVNAQIASTHLGPEGHGIMSCYLNLTWGSNGQSFGGWNLTQPEFGTKFIRSILDTVGVERWEDLPGKFIRLHKEDAFGPIVEIGHITEDRWFNPKG